MYVFKTRFDITALSSVHFSHSVVSDSAIPCTAACQASLSITNSRSSLTFMSIQSVMPSNHLILCHPLLLPSIFPNIRVFSSELTLHIRWPKYWNFNFNISPSNEYSGLISFRIDWLDLLKVQGTFKSLLQHRSSKASILWHSAFFMVSLVRKIEVKQGLVRQGMYREQENSHLEWPDHTCVQSEFFTQISDLIL